MKNNDNWVSSNCWLACFDILGFREMGFIKNKRDISEVVAAYTKGQKNRADKDIIKDYIKLQEVINAYEQALSSAKNSCDRGYATGLDYCWFSDTFLNCLVVIPPLFLPYGICCTPKNCGGCIIGTEFTLSNLLPISSGK